MLDRPDFTASHLVYTIVNDNICTEIQNLSALAHGPNFVQNAHCNLQPCGRGMKILSTNC
jgi:hypothetical protein